MMERMNERLRQLQRQVARKQRLRSRISELRGQHGILLGKVTQLEKAALAEEADVIRLQGRSLAVFFYNVVGKMDEKLDRERQEAYAARVKYDAAAEELRAVEQEIAAYSGELASLALCDDFLRICLEEKAAAIKAAGSLNGLEILRLEICIEAAQWQIMELNEALDAGRSALFMADHLQTFLENAANCGLRDLFGSSAPPDIRMGHTLDSGQTQIEQLQLQLRRFRTELADVRMEADAWISIGSFDAFADLFFDGLFADWAMMDRIGQALTQLRRTRSQIEGVLCQLETMLSASCRELESLRNSLDEQILGA